MKPRDVSKLIDNPNLRAKGHVVRFGGGSRERAEVISLFVEMLAGGECHELKGDVVLDTWQGVAKFVDLVHFLLKNKCKEQLDLFCHQAGNAVMRSHLGAVWGVILGCIAKNADLVLVSLQNGAIDDTWKCTEDGVATDGLTAAEGSALMATDAESGGAKVLLGSNRLDPGSWSKAMRDAINSDYFLALCVAWTKIERDLSSLEGYFCMSPTELDSNVGSAPPSPKTSTRPSPENKRSLLSRGGATYFRSRLTEVLSLGSHDKGKSKVALNSAARASTTATDGGDISFRDVVSDPWLDVFARYAEEFSLALAELRRRTRNGNPMGPKERMRKILSYGVMKRTRMND